VRFLRTFPRCCLNTVPSTQITQSGAPVAWDDVVRGFVNSREVKNALTSDCPRRNPLKRPLIRNRRHFRSGSWLFPKNHSDARLLSLSSVSCAGVLGPHPTGGNAVARRPRDLYRQTLPRRSGQLKINSTKPITKPHSDDKLRRERLTKHPDCPECVLKIRRSPSDRVTVSRAVRMSFDMGGGRLKCPSMNAFESRSRESHDSRQPLRDPKAQEFPRNRGSTRRGDAVPRPASGLNV